MANSVEWARYYALKDMIANAVDEELHAAGYDAENWYGVMAVMISPDLDEVQVYLDGNINEELGGWNVEYASSVEDANSIADLYFDLR